MTPHQQTEKGMQKAHKVILAMGSNYRRHANMQKAMMLIGQNLQAAVFTQAIDTEPIGMETDMFLNAMASAQTTLSIDETIAMLKDIEAKCGNTAELRQEGKIVMDIDLMQYDGERLHKNDWNRPYIKHLHKELDNKRNQQPSTIET